MGIYPTLKAGYQQRMTTEVFGGYNHNMKIGDGEFYHMENLTSDHYPLLANRPKRGRVKTLDAPHGLLGKSQLAYIDGDRLYYGALELTTYLQGAGFVLSDDPAMLPKQLVSMGAYIVIYPDRLYINTENFSDCGSMEAVFTTSPEGSVGYSLCKADGTACTAPTVSAAAPTEPENGALWIDSSGDTHVLKQYSQASAAWVEVPTVYTRLSYGGIGAGFSEGDGVELSGCAADSETAASVRSQIDSLNGSHIIAACGADYIVVTGLLDQSYTQVSGSVTVARRVPDMDFITEAGNRLWGCKYGLVDGKTVNEIYCCALGDFKNWQQYRGLSTDSYRASVGTDGPWTGAVTYLGYPIFFKEHCLHKVYVSALGAHQIVDTACRGVQQGSHKSLVVVNETLYYKSPVGVCAYDGSLPVSVSDAFGGVKYTSAVAGGLGDKYYISMMDSTEQWHLFVLDTGKGFWHREDGLQVTDFARCGGELYAIACTESVASTPQSAAQTAPLAQGGQVLAMTGAEGTLEDDLKWMAETGLMGYNAVQRKYVSRLNLRMKLPEGSGMDVYIQYDSVGDWHHGGHVNGAGVNTFLLPVRPRRCDHFRIRLVGTGEVRLYSLSKILEIGSDVG